MSCKTISKVLSFSLLALAATGAWAASARIEGLVVDVADLEKPIRDAVVTVTASDGSDQQFAKTNRRGKFTITLSELAPGYTMRVEAEGYAPYEGPLEPLEDRTLDITIPLLSEEVAKRQRAEIAAIEARNKAGRLYNEGATKYNEGDLEAALALFQEAAEEDEGLAIAWAGMGRLHLEQERFAEAAEAFERYDEIEPGKEPVLQMLYDSYRGMGDSKKADALLDRLVTDFPSAGTAARIFNLGVEAIKASQLEEAQRWFEKTLEVNSEIYQAHLNLAHIHRAFGRWNETLEAVDAFLAKEADHPRALALRYQALRSLERLDEASQALAALREKAPEDAAEIFHEQGITLFNAGELEPALASFLAAIEVQPGHPRAHYRAGLCHASMGNNGKAREYLEKFIELAPEDPETKAAREMLAFL